MQDVLQCEMCPAEQHTSLCPVRDMIVAVSSWRDGNRDALSAFQSSMSSCEETSLDRNFDLPMTSRCLTLFVWGNVFAVVLVAAIAPAFTRLLSLAVVLSPVSAVLQYDPCPAE